MKERLPIFRERKWTVFVLAVVTATTLGFQCFPSIAVADEPTPAATRPSESAQPADKEKPQGPARAKEDELGNETCMECHNANILKQSKEELADQVVVGETPAPPRAPLRYTFGELSLAINGRRYSEGVHAEFRCVECHKDITEVPHPQRLQRVDCKACHEEDVGTVVTGAHGKEAGAKGPECIGCHDVHYGKGKDAYTGLWKQKVCLDCHAKSDKTPIPKAHASLYEPAMHLKLKCMACHKGEKDGVHYIPLVKTKVARCESCHSKNTILAKLEQKVDFSTKDFINKAGMKDFGYVVGAHRIPALDCILILVVLGPLALPIFHGGMRIITRRKEPLQLPEEKILLHPLTERIWHWVHAVCIIGLIITGTMIHWPEKFSGFQIAVTVHNWFGIITVMDFMLWLFYNLGTKRIRHYIPRAEDIPTGMITQAKFYAYGIFKHHPHPYAPSEDNKFNPLQKFAYLQFQVMLMPVLLLSGILYMFPDYFRGVIAALGGLTVLATVHLILGALFTAFLVAHLYLATTGETVGENFKAIIFGYGVKMDHHHHDDTLQA